jgi:hypothetical protein
MVLATLAGVSGAVGGWTEFDQPLAPSVVRELVEQAPAGSVVRIVHDGAVVTSIDGRNGLDRGRRLRVCTPTQYLALLVRDGRCRWPGCTIPASWCDADHLHSWEHGGLTDLNNLWLLCSHHHSEKHRAGVVCIATSQGAHGGTNGPVTIRLVNGAVLTSAPAGPITRAGAGVGAGAGRVGSGRDGPALG